MKAGDKPIIVEESFDRPIEAVWNSITVVDEMRRWFFENIPSFKPEVGFETRFVVENQGRVFPHVWKVTVAHPPSTISYTWKYDGYPGDSFVVFELSEQDSVTRLRLTVNVVESFPDDIPEFVRESCIEGWTYFIKKRLKEYLESAC